MTSSNHSNWLQSTSFIDSDHQDIVRFTESICAGCHSDVEKSVALYYAVRDQIRYDPFDLKYSRSAMRASTVLQKGSGYCVAKAVLLAATLRQQNIACRLGFADVTNHLSTPRLRSLMGTDLFIYHGYTEILLDSKWVKATPAFNLSLCTRFNVKPLDFDGTQDSVFHEFDTTGQKHMEYVREQGSFDDLPFDLIFEAYINTYPNFFKNFSGGDAEDFEQQAAGKSAKE